MIMGRSVCNGYLASDKDDIFWDILFILAFNKSMAIFGILNSASDSRLKRRFRDFFIKCGEGLMQG